MFFGISKLAFEFIVSTFELQAISFGSIQGIIYRIELKKTFGFDFSDFLSVFLSQMIDFVDEMSNFFIFQSELGAEYINLRVFIADGCVKVI